LRGLDLNLRPSGYEPDELSGCDIDPDAAIGLLTAIRSKASRYGTVDGNLGIDRQSK